MAVPKKKTSKSRRNQRRGGNGTFKLKLENVITDSLGNYGLSHHVVDGFYKGREVIKKKSKTEEKELAQ